MNIFTQGDTILAKLLTFRHVKSAAFVLAFTEATISPILPEAFVALLLAYRKDISWKLLSCISALGSATGALGMYVVGKFLYASYGERIIHFFNGESFVEKANILFLENAFMAQFFASLTPLPDRVFSFLAGAFLISPITIFAATFLGRLCRVLPVAYLSYEYGDEARVYIKQHTRLAGFVLIVLTLAYVLYRSLLA